jgi:hypothetical protein
MSTLLHKLTAAGILLAATAIVPACLNASQEANVQAAIAANKAKVASVCATDILPYTNGLPGAVVAGLSPKAGIAVATVNATCDPANLDKVAQSASTIAFLLAEKTVISTNGAVQPATVAPAPITAATVSAS